MALAIVGGPEMKKTFCDICGAEIGRHNHPGTKGPGRIAGEYQKNGVKLSYEVIVGKDGVTNEGDFCRYCIMEALAHYGGFCRFCDVALRDKEAPK
jgi:hypothetical protein